MNTIKFQYNFRMWQFATNCLLKLYSEVRGSERNIPPHQRNKILLEYMTATMKSKKPEWSLLKGDLKWLLKSGKKRNADVEAKVSELKDTAQSYLTNHTDRLFDLFSYLEDAHGFDSKLINDDDPIIAKCIYTDQKAIESAIEAPNSLDKLELFILPGHTKNLIEAINTSWLYTTELAEQDSQSQFDKLYLHPVARN